MTADDDAGTTGEVSGYRDTILRLPVIIMYSNVSGLKTHSKITR